MSIATGQSVVIIYKLWNHQLSIFLSCKIYIEKKGTVRCLSYF